MVAVDPAELASSPLLADLLQAELESLARVFTSIDVVTGSIVIREGEVGDSMFIVVHGTLDVVTQDVVVAHLTRGDFFGEISLIDKEPRSATVRASSNALLYVLTHDALHEFAKTHRNGFTWLMVNVARGLAQKLREANRKLATRS